MVCNEPLRPGQRLEPDCPGFFIVQIANPANAETAFCFAFPATLQRPQSALRAVLDHLYCRSERGLYGLPTASCGGLLVTGFTPCG